MNFIDMPDKDLQTFLMLAMAICCLLVALWAHKLDEPKLSHLCALAAGFAICGAVVMHTISQASGFSNA